MLIVRYHTSYSIYIVKTTVHAHTHTQTNIRIHTHTHAHTHTRMYIHSMVGPTVSCACSASHCAACDLQRIEPTEVNLKLKNKLLFLVV